ncbi:hypothetical protein B0A81_11475 [Flavobacterium plurextorum]|uniref:Metallo-beta-lactamase domain-containing protein n=1 Tax=Flavobacterium plurextorum TaxID=1114867 RepID=A0ABX4CVI1_9FLAO|nr:MBL fold metallo-hydrolase [Flavobacterium plurextorum]OXB07364.1 hypothetical protein B0A81_11475 [Flavobacterium plurextorum]
MIGPKKNEVEITLIGTGGGYGECILIKLGESDWLIVDSCINPETKEPLPIEYLKSIGVDFTNQVKQVICTHWHDDHIKGMSRILELCPNADFSPTRVNDIPKFLQFIGFDEKINSQRGFRSTEEFSKCLKILNKRTKKNIARRLNADTVIYQGKIDATFFEIYAISPSESVVTNFDKEIGNLIEIVAKKKRTVIHKKPNETSVAILVKFLDQRIILGGDLEVGTDPNEGWLDVLNNVKVIDHIKAQLFKLPHHGSENGYDIRIFEKLIEKNSILKLTPWNHGSKLPTGEMIDNYTVHSSEIFITSPIISNKKPKAKQRSKEISKIIQDFNRTLEEVKFTEGIITSRFDYINPTGWHTQIYRNAYKIGGQ